jgi:hypothetical protein
MTDRVSQDRGHLHSAVSRRSPIQKPPEPDNALDEIVASSRKE